jgi:hypothetical protein
MESGPVDAGTSAEPATEGGETSTTNDELPAASEDATTQAADGAADEGVAAGTAQGGSAGAAAAGATVPAGEGSPGTFTLRNPGDEKVVVAFRCQTADETLFNYYAEVPPATIKRAKKLPATDRFEISISITDGPSESRRFENGGPNGQDVTVTVSPDTIGMEAESDDQQSDTTIEGTVEPRGESTEAGDGAPAASDDAPLEGDDAATDSTTADADSASGDGTDEREATDEQAESAVSDDPGDVLPNADSDSSGSVVSEDPDDVLPGVDEGADDGEQDAVAADSDPADEGESTGETTRAGTESEADGSADSSDSGSGFQALKEEFDSDEADWDDETSGSDGADDGEDLGGLDLGNPDGTGESDDDLGDIDEDVDDGAGDTEAADDSGSDDAGGGDDGDRSFAELKEEFESGDADWADEDEED